MRTEEGWQGQGGRRRKNCLLSRFLHRQSLHSASHRGSLFEAPASLIFLHIAAMAPPRRWPAGCVALAGQGRADQPQPARPSGPGRRRRPYHCAQVPGQQGRRWPARRRRRLLRRGRPQVRCGGLPWSLAAAGLCPAWPGCSGVQPPACMAREQHCVCIATCSNICVLPHIAMCTPTAVYGTCPVLRCVAEVRTWYHS